MQLLDSDSLRGIASGSIETWSQDQLRLLLRNGSATERAEAARQLTRFGAAAEPLLCLALDDRALRVRLAAAEALQTCGTERAVGPLSAALELELKRKSFRKGVAMALIVVVSSTLVIGPSLAIHYDLGVTLSAGCALPVVIWALFSVCLKGRQSRSAACLVFARVLTALAERHPGPEFRPAVKRLKRAAGDVFWHAPEARSASRKAARRIEALTREAMSLPVPSGQLTAEVQELPRVAAQSAAEPITLPRAANH